MKSLESLEKKNRFLGAKICFRSRDIKGPTRAWKPFAEEAVGLDLLALGIEKAPVGSAIGSESFQKFPLH